MYFSFEMPWVKIIAKIIIEVYKKCQALCTWCLFLFFVCLFVVFFFFPTKFNQGCLHECGQRLSFWNLANLPVVPPQNQKDSVSPQQPLTIQRFRKRWSLRSPSLITFYILKTYNSFIYCLCKHVCGYTTWGS